MPVHLPVGVKPSDWQRGSADAPVTIVEYGDFQCEDCRHAHPILQQILAESAPRVRFIARHLPLTDVHVHALDAAKAAEAAGRLGKFWEMYDALYSTEEKGTRDALIRIATEIGLDAETFQQAFADPQSYNGVREDVDGIKATGIGSTPTLFINGEKYEGLITLEALRQAVGQTAP